METEFYEKWFGPRHMKPSSEPLWEPVLTKYNRWWVDNSACIQEIYSKFVDENPKVDPNDCVEDAIEHMKERNGVDWFLMYVQKHHYDLVEEERRARRRRRHAPQPPSVPAPVSLSVQDPRNVWFVTFTSDPEKTEVQNKQAIDRYRTSVFKKFKYCWVEEHGTESGKYHQHVMIQAPKKNVHTGQGLKRSGDHYYKGIIDVQGTSYTKNGIKNRIQYMSKENQIQGDRAYFESLADSLPF